MTRRRTRPLRRVARRRPLAWTRLVDEELLDVRLCDLGLRVENSRLHAPVERLHSELAAAGLRFRPHLWLSTDWFTPEGIPGFAIPFFLAHPRLMRLERQQMLEVEGGTPEWCMNLLRHETAHTLDNAYGLHRRKGWREHFGPYSQPYGRTYVPRRNSRRFVLNLKNWYAQSHPAEDFAETFAVWLRPRSDWRTRYAGWPALRKLEYVDRLMREIGPRPARVRARERMDSLPTLRFTIREYYRRKQALYGQDDRSIYDRDLRRLFSDDPRHARRPAASSFLRVRRRELCRQVARWTGQHQFVVDEVLGDMIVRCRELRLRLVSSERETGQGAAVLVTVHTTQLLRTRHVEYFR